MNRLEIPAALAHGLISWLIPEGKSNTWSSAVLSPRSGIHFNASLGADLYTVSKLLGHTSVKMTQVYAKIVNKKKDDAVNLTNGLFD